MADRFKTHRGQKWCVMDFERPMAWGVVATVEYDVENAEDIARDIADALNAAIERGAVIGDGSEPRRDLAEKLLNMAVAYGARQ